MKMRSRLALAAMALVCGTCVSAQQAPAPAAADDGKFTLAFDKAPLSEVAKTLGEKLGELVLVDEGLEAQVTLNKEVTKTGAMLAVARAAELMPSRCVIFCTADEAKGGQELKRQAKAKLELAAETPLADFAKALETQTKIKVRCTADVAKLKVPAGVGELDIVPALNLVAKQAGCRWVMGWLLAKPDPAQLLPMLQNFSNLPAEQRQQIFDQRFDQAIKDFAAKPPAERQQLVQKIVTGLNSFAQRVQALDPQTRQQWSQAVGPLLDRGVQRFALLDAPTQAQLMPVLRAFQKLR